MMYTLTTFVDNVHNFRIKMIHRRDKLIVVMNILIILLLLVLKYNIY